MNLRPEEFVHQPLTALLKALDRRECVDFGGNDVCLYHTATGGPTIDDDIRLPVEVPEVEIRGVVLEQYLGGGVQGAVFAGRVTATGKIVAVKVFNRRSPRALREALLAGRVRHPHVIRVLQSQPAGDHWVVVSELIQGTELSARQRPAEPRACFRQLAEAVAAVGRAGLVHRDVKPANVLLRRPDASPVLVDFGLAVEVGASGDDDADISGTPMFLPPEAWDGAAPAPAWDAYALGVTVGVVLASGRWYVDDLPTLRSAKLSGLFDAELHRALQSVPDEQLREWATGLTQRAPEERLATLAYASEILAC